MQADDIRASFLFMGDLNGHHQEWLGFTTTNRPGVAVFGGTHDLLMTDVPDLVRVSVTAAKGN